MKMETLRPEVIQIAPQTWCISEFRLVNAFLLEGRDRAVLIDTGCGIADLSRTVSQLTDRPLLVLLTHGHADHTGGLIHFPDAPVCLKEEDRDLFLKGDPQGDLILREAIREYLHAARGVNCDASQIIIGAGNEYLLMLLSQLLGKDAVIAMEDPTYRQAYRVLSGVGHKVLPVGIDKNGFCVKELEDQTAQAAYVMPSHQFPTGIVMPVKRRQELLSWAGELPGRYLIEDDYDSEFRYKGKPIPALQGMDQTGSVVYMGTFSKAIAPAIRVGYMVLPESLLSVYRKKGRFYSSTVSRVDQRILANFISGGYFERHLNRMREIYKGKHDVLLGALKPLEKRFEIKGEYAGLHVLLTDRKGEAEQALLAKAEEKKVRVYGLSGFCMEERRAKESHTIVLGYAGLTEEEIRKGVELLREALE